MGAGKSKQFPITYEEACKRGKMKKKKPIAERRDFISAFPLLISSES